MDVREMDVLCNRLKQKKQRESNGVKKFSHFTEFVSKLKNRGRDRTTGRY